MLRLLVFGKSGQLATSLREYDQTFFEVVTLSRDECDISDRKKVIDTVSRYKPFLVVNAAAYTSVDQAENDCKTANAINADGAGNIAHASSLFDIPIIHFSTDYVFAGNQPNAYVEDDPTGPTGVYGRSKLEGEMQVARENLKHFIVRTAWVYSATGHNFLKSMLRLAQNRDVLTIVHDQTGNPTHSDDLASAVFVIARRLMKEGTDGLYGIYHLCGPQKMSWADFARSILQASDAINGPFAQVRNITSAEYPTDAERPANSSLSCDKFKDTFDFENTAFDISIRETVAAVLLLGGSSGTESC